MTLFFAPCFLQKAGSPIFLKFPDPKKKSGWPDKLDQGADWLGEDAWSYYITPYLRITEKEKMYFENFWIENVLVVRVFQVFRVEL